MVQHARRHEEEAGPARGARDAQAVHGQGPRASLLRRPRQAGAGRRDRILPDPRRDTRLLQDVPSLAADPRVFPREGTRNPGEDLLQVRGQQHVRLAQAELCRRAGILRKGAGPQGRDDRDGRGTVGNGPFDGVRVLRARLPRLHGEVLVRAEALPPRGHEDLRRVRDAVPVDDDPDRREDQPRASRDDRLARLRYF